MNNPKNIIYFILIGFYIIFCSCEQTSLEDYKAFEYKMVKVLGLKFVLKNDYGNSQIRIFNDTIVAFTVSNVFNKKTNLVDENHIYSVQSIDKPQNKIEFNNPELRFPSISPIDQFRNGCLYFGRFGKSTVQSLCSDGKLTEYFKQYNDTLFYANKVLLYKNLAVVNSMNGIFLFNLKNQQLLWERKYQKELSPFWSTIIGRRLIFSGRGYVSCLNLDNLIVEWSRKIGLGIYGGFKNGFNATPIEHILNDGNDLVIPTDSACYLFDLITGKTVSKTPWKDIVSKESQYQTYFVENKKLYTSSTNNKNTLLCIDMVTNKKLWTIPYLDFVGIHKNHVLAIIPSQKLFVVINKNTGKIEHKVANPNVSTSNFRFIDGYVLINSLSLYK